MTLAQLLAMLVVDPEMQQARYDRFISMTLNAVELTVPLCSCLCVKTAVLKSP